VAASAIADPDAFVAQTKGHRAQVQVATWKDHHDFRDQDLAWLAKAARKADFVVVTQKDAVKLRDRWPASAARAAGGGAGFHVGTRRSGDYRRTRTR
jgi:tetraacyldisaccharide-1-P 4'-kinase